MKLLKRWFALVALAMLVACGGGGGGGGEAPCGRNCGPGDGGGGTAVATASDLVVSLASPTISNDGSGTVQVVATALDAKRNVLPDVPVVLAVDENATIQVSGARTGDDGTVTGTVGIGADRSNRVITITAIASGITRVASLAVVDTPSSATPAAADLTLVLSSATLDNGGSNTVTATVTAVDSRRNTVAQVPVTFTVDSSAVITPAATVTNSNGVVTARIGIGADRSSRAITVSATSGTITKSASFAVYGAKLTASLSPLVDAGSVDNRIEYQLVDNVGGPMVASAITVTSPELGTRSGVTDARGKFVYTYDAPRTAGSYEIVATAAGESLRQTVSVQSAGSGSVPVAGAVASASLAPTPSVVTVNTAGSTSNQAELRALFLGANNRAVPNVRVRFDLANNANNTDGVVSWLGGTYAYSDENGVARGVFTPGLRSSPTNGVTVRACWDVRDFDANSCPNEVTNTLTVTSEALSVNIRTNELIQEGSAKLTYIKQFVAMVVDAAGQAKADVTITPSVDLLGYSKGTFFWNGDAWVQRVTAGLCGNEDVNRNGVREDGEDVNGNGELDPRKSDVAIRMLSSKTDSSGLAIVQIEYGKNLASWVDFLITVTASGISGTESRARFAGTLPYPASAVTNEQVPPAFALSPYGRASTCTDPN